MMLNKKMRVGVTWSRRSRSRPVTTDVEDNSWRTARSEKSARPTGSLMGDTGVAEVGRSGKTRALDTLVCGDRGHSSLWYGRQDFEQTNYSHP